MSKPLSVLLPFFDATSPPLVMEQEELARHGAALVRNGDDYSLRFYGGGDALGVAGTDQGSWTELGSDFVKPLTHDAASEAGFDILNPKVESLHNLCMSLQSQVVVWPVEQRLKGHSMLTVFIDQNFNFEGAESRRVYTCPKGDWLGDERKARSEAYKCPNDGETLR